MATDTVPAAVPGPPDPPPNTAATPANAQTATKGFLASMVAPVEPARATFDLAPTNSGDTHQATGDGVLDRSAPGKSSASFHDTDQAATNDPAGQKRKAQGSIWKAWWLAGAQRWAKGGGTANKRLDVKKAQAQANQVKEARTTTVSKSAGLLPVRNSGGSGAGAKGNSGKSGGTSGTKGPVNSSGNRSGGAGRGGSGGGRGPGGNSGGNAGGAGRGRDSAGHGKGPGTKGPGTGGSGKGSSGAGGASGSGASGKSTNAGGKSSGGHDSKTPKGPKDSSSKEPAKEPGKGSGTGSGGSSSGSGKPGAAGTPGAAGKDGKPTSKPAAGTSGGSGGPGSGTGNGKTDKTRGKDDTIHKTKHNKGQPDTRTPLEKSRETGHKDGSAVRGVVDHVKAYKDGAVDGYRDKRHENAREHARLDKAHDKHKPKTPNAPTSKGADKAPLRATVHGQNITITDDNAPMEDPVMSKPTPIQAQGIDATNITLGDGFLKGSVKRSELRRFKDYEGRLEGRINGLAKVADATKALAAQARAQADECQQLAEQAKGVKGGEKLVGSLTKLTDQANAQADEADEVHKRAVKAHDFAKAVLSNVQTRYAPLYQAVVDGDETKPAELKFYADRGIYPTNTTLAA